MKPELHIEPEIIIKRVKDKHGGGHHGGAWKIAYADFVTAMMAFFLLMWLLGATNEDQRKGLADYFTPTIIQMKNSGGSNGVLGGRSLQEPDGAAEHATAKGKRPVAIAGGGGQLKAERQKQLRADDDARFRQAQDSVAARLASDPTMSALKGQVRFVKVRDGLRIDIIERADFSMFGSGTSVFTGDALKLVHTVAQAVRGLPNALTVRGHTDSVAYNSGDANNWTLSTLRADATRRALSAAGTDAERFRRIEGVADTDPFNTADRTDPRNRRISVTLLYRE